MLKDEWGFFCFSRLKYNVHTVRSVSMISNCFLTTLLNCYIRTVVAPLERLKLEYMVRGEQKNLFELIKTVAASQGLKGFWKGNFVNILRTAPFKAINFYAYETYRNQLLKLSGNKEATNFERFVAGAAAGMTATVLCIPMDTVSNSNINHWCIFN